MRRASAQLDVADRAATAQVFDDHVAAYGGLDIAFANAGIDPGDGFWNPGGYRNPDGQIDTLDPARWDRTIAINLTGVFNTIREAARVMKADGRQTARGGSIITTSSNAALVNEAIVGVPYMAAKAGVTHFVRHAAYELAEFGIRVNAIAPGPFVTNIGDGWLKKDPVCARPGTRWCRSARIAETYQIKPLALYLASDASSYVTGSHVLIDGGMALGKFNDEGRRHAGAAPAADHRDPARSDARQTGELVVRVGRCGICGSRPAHDRGPGLREAARATCSATNSPARWWRSARAPSGVALGDLVSVIPLKSCGACAACRAGERRLVRPVRAAGRRLCRICADAAQPVRHAAADRRASPMARSSSRSRSRCTA